MDNHCSNRYFSIYKSLGHNAAFKIYLEGNGYNAIGMKRKIANRYAFTSARIISRVELRRVTIFAKYVVILFTTCPTRNLLLC